ncbi:MAG: hypothetical protein MAG715_00236 [Methanonatronarchaeales archaeon]|nr:hypothetical protein [Methanonatronarchaeales archaeon]
MISNYFDFLKKVAATESLSEEVEVLKESCSRESGYIRFVIRLGGGSELHVFEHVTSGLEKTDYSYHWQDAGKELLIRWDNAPHHPEVDTFPHHKHRGDEVTDSTEPSLTYVLKTVHRELTEK